MEQSIQTLLSNLMRNIDDFKKLGFEKYNDKYDYSNSEYKGQTKSIKINCPIHGEVELPTVKSHFVRSGCFLCDVDNAKKQRRSGKYSKTKGNNYELKIAHELNSIGFKDVVTSRSESKRFDAKKVDLVSLSNDLPFYAQLKCTANTPDYFGIREKSGLADKPFIVFWNRQSVKPGQVGMTSEGEIVMIPKEYFYELVKPK